MKEQSVNPVVQASSAHKRRNIYRNLAIEFYARNWDAFCGRWNLECPEKDVPLHQN